MDVLSLEKITDDYSVLRIDYAEGQVAVAGAMDLHSHYLTDRGISALSVKIDNFDISVGVTFKLISRGLFTMIKNAGIECLDLSGCNMGCLSICFLVDFLKNYRMKVVDIRNNNISLHGLEYILDGIRDIKVQALIVDQSHSNRACTKMMQEIRSFYKRKIETRRAQIILLILCRYKLINYPPHGIIRMICEYMN